MSRKLNEIAQMLTIIWILVSKFLSIYRMQSVPLYKKIAECQCPRCIKSFFQPRVIKQQILNFHVSFYHKNILFSLTVKLHNHGQLPPHTKKNFVFLKTKAKKKWIISVYSLHVHIHQAIDIKSNATKLFFLNK